MLGTFSFSLLQTRESIQYNCEWKLVLCNSWETCPFLDFNNWVLFLQVVRSCRSNSSKCRWCMDTYWRCHHNHALDPWSDFYFGDHEGWFYFSFTLSKIEISIEYFEHYKYTCLFQYMVAGPFCSISYFFSCATISHVTYKVIILFF